jgi:hypothetical protein
LGINDEENTNLIYASNTGKYLSGDIFKLKNLKHFSIKFYTLLKNLKKLVNNPSNSSENNHNNKDKGSKISTSSIKGMKSMKGKVLDSQDSINKESDNKWKGCVPDCLSVCRDD